MAVKALRLFAASLFVLLFSGRGQSYYLPQLPRLSAVSEGDLISVWSGTNLYQIPTEDAFGVIGVTVQGYDADLTTLGAGGASARAFLGLTIGTHVQAYSADLAAIATQTTTSFGRQLLNKSDASAARTHIDAQQLDSDLTALAALNTDSFGRDLLIKSSGAAVISYIGAQTSDADLTAIADLATAAYGRGLLEMGSSGSALTYLTAQPLDADLTSLAAVNTDAFGRGLLALTTAAALRTSAGTVIGTDVQAYDADLTTYAGLTPSANVQTLLGAANFSAFRTSLGVAIGTDVQAYDSDLVAIAAINSTSAGRTVLAMSGTPAAGHVVAHTGSAWASTSGPQITTVELGHATDTTIARSAAGEVTVEGKKITGGEFIEYALSDETTDITAGTAKFTVRAPFAVTVTAVRASLTTESSSGIPTVDINEGGTTILSTKLTVDASEKTSTTAATAAVISDSAIADDAEITFDVDVAGTGAKGLKVRIYYTR